VIHVSSSNSSHTTVLRRITSNFYEPILKLLKSTHWHSHQSTTTMSITHNPTQSNPERGLALQKYLLLHSQHDALQKHLTQISPSVPTPSTASPSHSPDRFRHASLSSSPSDNSSYLSSSPPTPIRHHHRSGSIPLRRPTMQKRRSSLPTVIDERTIHEIAEDEMKLKNVNQQIKSTLTDLLNCESVRRDQRYRMWVQTRLMDAEKELKGSRSRSCDRRRSEDVSGMF